MALFPRCSARAKDSLEGSYTTTNSKNQSQIKKTDYFSGVFATLKKETEFSASSGGIKRKI